MADNGSDWDRQVLAKIGDLRKLAAINGGVHRHALADVIGRRPADRAPTVKVEGFKGELVPPSYLEDLEAAYAAALSGPASNQRETIREEFQQAESERLNQLAKARNGYFKAKRDGEGGSSLPRR